MYRTHSARLFALQSQRITPRGHNLLHTITPQPSGKGDFLEFELTKLSDRGAFERVRHFLKTSRGAAIKNKGEGAEGISKFTVRLRSPST